MHLHRSKHAVVPLVTIAILLGAAALFGRPTPIARAVTPTSIVVTTALDPSLASTACPAAANQCSLRQAVATAVASGGTSIITFSVPGPIVLTQGQMLVNRSANITINGRADGRTIIDANHNSRIFQVEQPGTSLTLNGVTLLNGNEVVSAASSGNDDGYGGAIDVNSGAVLSVADSTISGNQAANDGGAINDNTTSAVTVVRSLINGNSASRAGGIDANTSATLSVINSTLAGNSTSASPTDPTALGGGAAINALTASTVTLVNDTISGNNSTGLTPLQQTGGILAAANSSLTVTNTIVSGNSAPNCTGIITDGGNNLEDTASCGFGTANVHGNPLLAALGQNGGPTMTMALKPTSPAIGAGSNAACTGSAGSMDQRSVPRPQAAKCDIGAFEVVATTTTLSADQTSPLPGDTVNLSATVTPKVAIPGQPAGSVTFLDGTTVLGTATLSGASPDVASFSVSSISAGTHSYTAKFVQTPLFLESTSAPVSIAATAPAASPTPTAAPAGTAPAPAATPRPTVRRLPNTSASAPEGRWLLAVCLALVGLATGAWAVRPGFFRSTRVTGLEE